jgi:hypothetical protein
MKSNGNKSWSNRLLHGAFVALLLAVMTSITVKLVLTLLPRLLWVAIVALVGFVAWRIWQFRRSHW